MHQAVRKFIKEVRSEMPYKFRLRKVLEVGSKNINGSPRRYFWFCNYTGIDLSAGKGVDKVMNFGRFTEVDLLPTLDFDCVVSTEMLEHCDTWEMCLKRMYHVLKPGGLLLITCAGPNRPEHGTTRTSPKDSPDTNDYYRNISIEDFESVLPKELFSLYVLQYARGGNDLQFYGIKK